MCRRDRVETVAELNMLEGMVIMATCDKVVPGMLMGALRVNIPVSYPPLDVYKRQRLHCEVYFADPYCAWQKGTNENLNGCLLYTSRCV